MKLCLSGGGLKCSCFNDSSSSEFQLECSVDFADSAIHPIPAIMNWIVNGEYYLTDTPYKDKMDTYVYTATSTFTISSSPVHDYQCTVTFGEPTDVQYPFIATNAPEFSETCSTPCVEKPDGGGSGSGDESGGRGSKSGKAGGGGSRSQENTGGSRSGGDHNDRSSEGTGGEGNSR